MKLWLDEQMSKIVAEELRRKGYDVIAATETEYGNRGMLDRPLLEAVIAKCRAFVTYNIQDFAIIARELASANQQHYGIILISSKTIPQHDLRA